MSTSTPRIRVLADAAVKFNPRQRAYRVEAAVLALQKPRKMVQGAAINGTCILLEFDGPFLHEFVWSGYCSLSTVSPPRNCGATLLDTRAGHPSRALYSLGQYESGLATLGIAAI